MVYLAQRIIQNHFQWKRPSPGRLGPHGEGEYVQDNGFGHEDWNFNKSLTVNGYIYGYSYYSPALKRRDDTFDIAFLTYTNRKWYSAGFYRNARFEENPPISQDILESKRRDLLLLGDSLGKEWKSYAPSKFISVLRRDSQYVRWKVRPVDVIYSAQPIPLPKSVFSSENYRLTRAEELTQDQFDAIWDYIRKTSSVSGGEEDASAEEGGVSFSVHRTKERNAALVGMAKRAFKTTHGRLFCEVCGFDFEKTYGAIGIDFIEAHHLVPVSKLKPDAKTHLKDLAMVCANCHRMLHSKQPWLDMNDLRKALGKRERVSV